MILTPYSLHFTSKRIRLSAASLTQFFSPDTARRPISNHDTIVEGSSAIFDASAIALAKLASSLYHVASCESGPFAKDSSR